MIWLLILVLNHPMLVKPNLLPMFVYPKPFLTKSECTEELYNQKKKASVLYAYCEETNPKP